MELIQFIGLALGSGVIVAVINQAGNYIIDRRKRKDAVEDKSDRFEEIEKASIERFAKLSDSTSKRFDTTQEEIQSLTRALSKLEGKTGVLMTNATVQAYDRIRHLGLSYIRQGKISPKELWNIQQLYAAYKKLGGNGFLDKIMYEIDKLRIVVDEDDY